MDHSMCGSGASWCARTDRIFGVEGMHVLAVRITDNRLVLDVETEQTLAGCHSCGVVAIGHGRRVHRLHDVPCFGRPVLIRWRKRVWRCDEVACPVGTFSEDHPYGRRRAKLTARAATWATDALSHDDTTVSALARHLGVDWHTAWAAIKTEATTRTSRPERTADVKTLGVDEHIWRPSMKRRERAVTIMVDLTRDEHGALQARLLDAVTGRSGTAYADWLKEQGLEFTVEVEHAALDPFRGYANAIRDQLPEATAVLDAFHVVKLGSQALDEVRRRVQQRTLHRRGHKNDPLYRIRRTLMTGREHLTDKQTDRLNRHLQAGDPGWEVTVAWNCYQELRAIYHATSPTSGRRLAEKVIEAFPSCPIPEIARLGRTLRAWRDQVLAYFTTDGVSNGGTEAINLVIEKTRRLAHGFRNFTNYRLRILLAASGDRPYRRGPNHA